MSKRTTGRNIWTNIDGVVIAVSEDRPTPKTDAELEDGCYPAYNPRRVRGDRYEPYTGSSEWVQAANEAMANAANYNFRNH